MMTRFEEKFLQKTGKSLEQALRDKANAGYIMHHAAQSLGISHTTLKQYAKQYAITFQRRMSPRPWTLNLRKTANKSNSCRLRRPFKRHLTSLKDPTSCCDEKVERSLARNETHLFE